MDFKKNKKSMILWIILGLLALSVFNLYRQKMTNAPRVIDYSDFIDRVQEGRVQEVALQGEVLEALFRTGERIQVFLPKIVQLQNLPLELFKDKGVRFRFLPLEVSFFNFYTLLQIALPFLTVGLIWFLYYRQTQGGGGRAMGFGQSKINFIDPDQHHIRFSDVEGAEDAKEDLQEVVDFLKNPEKFELLGGRIPKGVLLVGPPGTGKTLLAKAVAGEAGVPFIFMSGSDFVEMFVGVGASRVRDLFRQARERKPCIIFIDEIDAVGRARGGHSGGGHDERDQTLNQLLVEMDGFSGQEGIILIAATNRADVLDKALVRPGRFDRQVIVPLPDLKGREGILKVHTRKVRLSPEVSLLQIARGTIGFSGADLANLVNEAALRAARLNKSFVDKEDFESGRDKIIMGPERKNMIMTDLDRRLTAFHEAGHALIASLSSHSDPIHKATIVPRGVALGLVMRLPETDKVSVTRASLLADLDIALAGRVAEEMMFGEDGITTGASSDFKFATNLARKMVTHWGMSKKIGYLFYGEKEEYWGGIASHVSDQEVNQIDEEIRKLLKEAHQRTFGLLMRHKEKLILLAETLLKYETLSGEEINELLDTGELKRKILEVEESSDTLDKQDASTESLQEECSDSEQSDEKSETSSVSVLESVMFCLRIILKHGGVLGI
ncbi:ATP-dependent zinc metalloprotease FtsH [Holospora obtusa F1]|uniref:ATP-dependent zinc metalloprotease FtsH n=1 Tax=Holospora obtusa F1 TaxID=1399147 RepID=W6TIB2_HOLOB|nr:ATP-dependent zinc metalloprotease FtsH [Holospora obtusa]ETZ07755.1 ATP-dependent zinc metalloprotease FtsH [Holospora obtusa F1]